MRIHRLTAVGLARKMNSSFFDSASLTELHMGLELTDEARRWRQSLSVSGVPEEPTILGRKRAAAVRVQRFA